jgi:hypothetical protein
MNSNSQSQMFSVLALISLGLYDAFDSGLFVFAAVYAVVCAIIWLIDAFTRKESK